MRHLILVLLGFCLVPLTAQAQTVFDHDHLLYGWWDEEPTYLALANGDTIRISRYHFYLIGQNPESEDATETCTGHFLISGGERVRAFGACSRIYLSGDTHQLVWYITQPDEDTDTWHTISGTGKYESLRCEGTGRALPGFTAPWRPGQVPNTRFIAESKGTCKE